MMLTFPVVQHHPAGQVEYFLKGHKNRIEHFENVDFFSIPVKRDKAVFLATKSATRTDLTDFVKNNLGQLAQNWDSENAYPIHPDVLSNTIMLLTSIPSGLLAVVQEDDIIPNPSGTIAIEWSNQECKIFLEIGKTYATFFVKSQGKTVVMDNDFNPVEKTARRAFIRLLNTYFPA